MLDDEYTRMHAQELVHWWFRGRRRLLLGLLSRHAAEVPGRRLRILDFGCGTGGNAVAYSILGRVVGIEPDPNAVRLASERTIVAAPENSPMLCRAVGGELPLQSGSFDVVVASDVLEHMSDDHSAAAEIARVLRPGGIFVFTVPAYPWLWSSHDLALWHHRRYTRRAVEALLHGGGLRPRWVSYWNSALFPAVAMYRLALRGSGGAPKSDAQLLPPLVNELLFQVLKVENALLSQVRLPFGASLVGVAERV